MFGGIIMEIGQVSSLKLKDGLLTYSIKVSKDFLEGLALGESVAVNGICQSVTKMDGCDISFDAIKETLDVTNLQFLSEGDLVNLEKSLMMKDRISGHISAGHIGCMGQILTRKEDQGQIVLKISCPSPWIQYMLPKGFVTIEGISLTIGHVDETGLEVYLIPDTLERTTLSDKQVGDYLNIEVDHMTQAVFEAVKKINSQLTNC